MCVCVCAVLCTAWPAASRRLHPNTYALSVPRPPPPFLIPALLPHRGRFLELHVEELPDSELADILHQRCGIAPSYASKMVTVLRELQRRRQRSNVFAGRHGFITPRDLFRWAERGAVGYEALAVDGFCVLGERLRSGEERALVVEVLQSVLRVQLDMEQVRVSSLLMGVCVCCGCVHADG